MPVCINSETQRNFGSVMHKQIYAFTGEEKKACSLQLMSRIINEEAEMTKPLINAYKKIQNQEAAARQRSIDNALPPKQ